MTFEQLYDQHFAYVWRSLRRLGVPASDAADATQEVFLIVHRKHAEFEGRSKVSTWLFGICYRVASVRRRSARRRPEIPHEMAHDDRPVELDPGADLERRQERAQLERLLDAMSLEQRAVFTLYELEGLEGEAIAALLELPRGTVYSRLRSAREIFWRGVDQMRARERATDVCPEGSS
ncbi:MAG TPA: sigma-70 family RNA polymerase sigma factor [Polyangiaceae bacterium]|nr:sigma-70 family RNA polymerase sigma factor [Polyangiaceae bacterium]